MASLSNLFQYPALSVRKAHHSAYEKMNPIANPVELVDQQTLLGIEIEVENITQYMDFNHYWSQKEDNSLRNNGREFVSIPLRAYQVEYALNHLERVFTACEVKPVFSSRCSVHVHMNVRDFTPEQLQVFFLLYRLFEKHFFYIAGAKRESNIFCVPLYKTSPARLRSSELFTNMSSWHKYYALNIGTVSGNGDVAKYGTVEFRHLYGTLDHKILFDWINSILCLHKASKMYTVEELLTKIETLNTTSEYYHMYNTIFGKYTLNTQMTKYDFESCVSHVKISEFGNHYTTLSTASRYYAKYYGTKKKGVAYKTIIDNLDKKEILNALAQNIAWAGAGDVQKVIKFYVSPDSKCVATHGGVKYIVIKDTDNIDQMGLTHMGNFHHYQWYTGLNAKRYIRIPDHDIILFKQSNTQPVKNLLYYKEQFTPVNMTAYANAIYYDPGVFNNDTQQQVTAVAEQPLQPLQNGDW